MFEHGVASKSSKPQHGLPRENCLTTLGEDNLANEALRDCSLALEGTLGQPWPNIAPAGARVTILSERAYEVVTVGSFNHGNLNTE